MIDKNDYCWYHKKWTTKDDSGNKEVKESKVNNFFSYYVGTVTLSFFVDFWFEF